MGEIERSLQSGSISVKYYSIMETEITDRTWIADYVKGVTKLVEQRGRRFLARTSKIEKFEGDRAVPQIVSIIEWPSLDVAKAFYDCDEYRPYRQSRILGAKNELLLVAGEDISKAARIAGAE